MSKYKLQRSEVTDLTRTKVESRESAEVAPNVDDLIVSPASESTRRTFPHSSISASFNAAFTVLRGTSKRVFNAGAIDEISSSGLVGAFGGNRIHVGSAKH